MHKSAAGRGFPFAGADSSHGFSEGYAKCGEAVQDGDPDLKLGNLSVEVPGIQTLAQQLHTMRLRFDVACCRFRGHEDKIVTKEPESGYGETEVQP